MAKVSNWRSYQNGNTRVYINIENGTKFRTCDDDKDWSVDYPENIDITISTYCEHNCAFCYAGCSKNGVHADFGKYDKLLDSLMPYTEVAVNINSEIHPQFEEFIEKLSKRNVIVNATIRQDDFENNHIREQVEEWYNRGYLHGIGISLCQPTQRFIELAKQNPNYVIHTIAGITPMSDYNILANNGLKILILGYKPINRGDDYYSKYEESICNRIRELSRHLSDMIGKFVVISFDNAAIEQLGLEAMMTPEEFESFYMGDDGDFTMAINLADNTFASSSTSPKLYDLSEEDTINSVFAVIQNEVKNGKNSL